MQSARRRAGAAIPARPRDQPRNRAAGPSPIPPGPARGRNRRRACSTISLLVDHRWARVGSSNLNVSSLLGNYELDLLAECNQLAAALAQQFLRDLATSREIVLQARRRFLPARLVGGIGDGPAARFRGW